MIRGRKRVAIALLACLALLTCRSDRNAVHRNTFYVFGTLVDISIAGLDGDRASRLSAQINRDLQWLHQNWHAWQPGGLERINRAIAEGEPVTIDPALTSLLRSAQELEERSGGRFNPAIGTLVALWGFHTDDYPVVSPPPDADTIQELLDQRPSSLDLNISGNLLTSTNPAVALDLGGIGKGAAVDMAIRILAEAGASGAIVNAGGDLRAYGTRPDGSAWQIAIRDPRQTESEVPIALLDINVDEAVFTSGNYLRYRADDGERYGHIIDPRDGQPVTHVLSATVIAGNGTVADAAATSLVVAGPAKWREVAQRLGIEAAMIIDIEGCVDSTPAMARRIRFTDPKQCVTTS